MQQQRRDRILQILEAEQYVTVKYLTHLLDCSTATVNRDLNDMEQLGLLKRVYGGAEAIEHRLPPLQIRQFYMQKEKQQNAKAAAALIQNGETVFLDGSTTVQHIVPFLADKKDLTVITNSLFLSAELAKYKMEVISLGGALFERPYVLDSSLTVENAMKFRPDKMFFSLGGVTLQGEIQRDHPHLYTTLLRHSRESYLLTDHAKLTESFPLLLCDFSALTGVIADFEFPQETKTRFPNTRFICTGTDSNTAEK